MFQMYKMSMAAPGTIVLTVADPALKSDLKILNYNFTSLGGHFDSSLCTTLEQLFTTRVPMVDGIPCLSTRSNHPSDCATVSVSNRRT